jgi:SWI/SNF-related matrix-associated actin-dependent regulator of chromatin subfamily A member 5
MQVEDVYERIKRDITEFPVFRFDWFFKSRSPQELARRCTTLLSMIEKEADVDDTAKKPSTTSRGKVSCFFFSFLICSCVFLRKVLRNA